MKLELKHLAPYLPYNLKCEILDYKCDYVGEKYLTIKGYYLIGDSPYFNFHAGKEYAGKNTNNFKPILRPLSDLTKERARLAEIFETYDDSFDPQLLIEDYRWLNQMPYGLIEQLFEWHFDVFGLIEKGLAIDINTLQEKV